MQDWSRLALIKWYIQPVKYQSCFVCHFSIHLAVSVKFYAVHFWKIANLVKWNRSQPSLEKKKVFTFFRKAAAAAASPISLSDKELGKIRKKLWKGHPRIFSDLASRYTWVFGDFPGQPRQSPIRQLWDTFIFSSFLLNASVSAHLPYLRWSNNQMHFDFLSIGGPIFRYGHHPPKLLSLNIFSSSFEPCFLSSWVWLWQETIRH